MSNGVNKSLSNMTHLKVGGTRREASSPEIPPDTSPLDYSSNLVLLRHPPLGSPHQVCFESTTAQYCQTTAVARPRSPCDNHIITYNHSYNYVLETQLHPIADIHCPFLEQEKSYEIQIWHIWRMKSLSINYFQFKSCN